MLSQSDPFLKLEPVWPCPPRRDQNARRVQWRPRLGPLPRDHWSRRWHALV